MKTRSLLYRILLAMGVVLVAMLVSSPSYGADGSFDRTLKVTGTPDVDVSTGSGSIRVHTGDVSTVHVVGTIHASSIGNWFSGDGLSPEERVRQLEQNPPIDQTGNMIRIGHIEDRDLRNVSISYDITVPPPTRLHAESGSGAIESTGVKGETTAHAGSGRITITGAGAGANVHTGSGDIELRDVAGDVRAEAGSGDIRLQKSGAGNVDVETGSGSVELHGVNGHLHAETGSGDIQADGTPAGDWMLDTGSGGVTLRIPGTVGFDLYAHTGSGHVDVQHELTVQGRLSRHEIRGRVKGGGSLVEVKTGSGSIEVD